jgi:hypothetical protein
MPDSNTHHTQWQHDHSSPARVWQKGTYEIVWDPAGETPGAPGGYYLWDAHTKVGIFPSLDEAKRVADAR